MAMFVVKSIHIQINDQVMDLSIVWSCLTLDAFPHFMIHYVYCISVYLPWRVIIKLSVDKYRREIKRA